MYVLWYFYYKLMSKLSTRYSLLFINTIKLSKSFMIFLLKLPHYSYAEHKSDVFYFQFIYIQCDWECEKCLDVESTKFWEWFQGTATEEKFNFNVFWSKLNLWFYQKYHWHDITLFLIFPGDEIQIYFCHINFEGTINEVKWALYR